jgi:hypothetical protein
LNKPADQEPELVMITWRDACTYSGWRDRKTAHKETGPAHCVSVGWLLTNTKEEVTIYATRAHDPDDPDINSIISIPAAWVEKMERLNVKSAKRIPVFFAGEKGAKLALEVEAPGAHVRQGTLGDALWALTDCTSPS